MSLQVKYSGVLALAQELKFKDLNISEEGGALKLSGTANTQYEKNAIWGEIMASDFVHFVHYLKN